MYSLPHSPGSGSSETLSLAALDWLVDRHGKLNRAFVYMSLSLSFHPLSQPASQRSIEDEGPSVNGERRKTNVPMGSVVCRRPIKPIETIASASMDPCKPWSGGLPHA